MSLRHRIVATLNPSKEVSMVFQFIRQSHRLLALPIILALFLLITSCSGTTLHEDHDQAAGDIIETPADVIDYHITFNGREYTIDHTGAIATDKTSFVIIKGGVYHLSGNREGQIQISVSKEESVTLILDNLTLSCADSAAIYVKSAECVFIEVPEGKTSTLTDASTYIYTVPGETKPNACIYASDDLTFRGLGTLNIKGNYNNGIGCKNDIVFKSGQVNVTAANNGVKGEGSVTLQDNARLNILYAEDGIKSDGVMANEGIITIKGNAIASISCADDALQATFSVTVDTGTTVYYDCEGSIVNSDGLSNVAEGTLKPLD